MLSALLQFSFAIRKEETEVPYDKPAPELACIGEEDGRPFFRLHLPNQAGNKYRFTIFSRKREILFEEKLEGENILRIYKLDADDYVDISKTTFELVNCTNNERMHYAIKSTSKTVQDIFVAKR